MNNIETARKEMGMSRKQLADAIGVTPSTVFRYEAKNAKPTSDILQKLSKALGVTADYLCGNAMTLASVVFVPVIDKTIGASAGTGNGIDGVEWNTIDEYPIASAALMGYSWQGADCKIICAEGNSMEPVIHDGAKVLFAANIEVMQGDIAIVSVDNRLFVKGVLYNKNGTLTLVSFNKAEYPDRIIDPENQDVRILGKVLYIVPDLQKVAGVI